MRMHQLYANLTFSNNPLKYVCVSYDVKFHISCVSPHTQLLVLEFGIKWHCYSDMSSERIEGTNGTFKELNSHWNK